MILQRKSRPSPPGGALPQQVRIIGGRWKRTPLPVASAPGLRPTPDRVRVTLFNWIVHLRGGLDGLRVLDLFAGSGALGFEAASRGAAQVVMVENNPNVARNLLGIKNKLGADQVDVRVSDALVQLGPDGGSVYDLVFLDPPFGQGWVERVWPLLPAVLAPGALVYVEAEEALPPPPGWEALRADRAGAVAYQLWQAAQA